MSNSVVMKKMSLKFLIAVCVLPLFVEATAVDYKFDKSVSGRRASAASLEAFDVESYAPFGSELNYTQSVASRFNMISSQGSAQGGSSSLISPQTSASSSASSLGFSPRVAAGTSLSKRAAADNLSIGSDMTGGSSVSVMTPFSTNSVNLSGPARLPGQTDPEPWPPVGDGLLTLLCMAGAYAVARMRKKRKE